MLRTLKYIIHYGKKNDDYTRIENYRLYISEILKNNDLKTPFKENKFYIFLLQDDFNQFNPWLEICGAKNNFDMNIEKLHTIINIFNKSDSIISFKKLFEINKMWYTFFYTSADIEGNLYPNEQRYGVSKQYVDDIIIIQKLTMPSYDQISLQDAITFYQNLKFIYYYVDKY